MKKILSLMVLIFILSIPCKSQSFTKSDLDDLMSRWDKRDGSAAINLSPKFAKFLIINDSVYFEAMHSNKNVYNSWLDDLQYNTFTIYSFQDPVDSILQKTSLEKLKELMLIQVNKNIGSQKYSSLASQLKTKLASIFIRFIN